VFLSIFYVFYSILIVLLSLFEFKPIFFNFRLVAGRWGSGTLRNWTVSRREFILICFSLARLLLEISCVPSCGGNKLSGGMQFSSITPINAHPDDLTRHCRFMRSKNFEIASLRYLRLNLARISIVTLRSLGCRGWNAKRGSCRAILLQD
jgi:hypothetical protein